MTPNTNPSASVASRRVTIRIADASGHSTLEQDLETAIQTVIDRHFESKQWPYVGSEVFQFTAESAEDTGNLLQDAARLRELLLANPEGGVTVTLTGELVGGAPAPKTPSVNERQVTLRIADASGHTTITEGLGAAVARVIAEHIENKKWAYVGSNVFQFDEEALNDPVRLVEETARLRNFIDEVEGDVTVTLTGELVGGSF